MHVLRLRRKGEPLAKFFAREDGFSRSLFYIDWESALEDSRQWRQWSPNRRRAVWDVLIVDVLDVRRRSLAWQYRRRKNKHR